MGLEREPEVIQIQRVRTMPQQKPGRSKQTYGTPPEFLNRVKELLRIEDFDIDLAASFENRVTSRFFGADNIVLPENMHGFAGRNALKLGWRQGNGWNYLNPPFAHIEPWVQRAWEQKALGARTAVLIPAGIGSNWWRNWVHRKAKVMILNGRLTFVGCPINPKTGKVDMYPKDLALLLYGQEAGYHIWDWRKRRVMI